MISLAIVGSNRALAETCRAIVDRLCPGEYHIDMYDPGDAPGGLDVYLWDVESSPLLPPAMAAPGVASKVVIASKRTLASLRRSLPHNDFQFLQLPVSTLSLRVVLEAAAGRLQQQQSPERLSLDRDKILQQLLASNLQLQESDQKRTNFLARSIHDVRVPLMAIEGYCDLLLAGEVGAISSEQSEVLARMQRSIKRLGGLLGGLADLNQSPGGDPPLNLENGSLEGCIQQAVHEIQPLAEKKQIALQVDLNKSNGALRFDSGKLEQALINLLDNACKFTPRRGSITVCGRSVGAEELVRHGLHGTHGGYRIDIRDSGPGVDAALLEKIFDEHVTYADTTDRPGSGLGLAICNAIVSAHHGKVWANAEPQGASFSLLLPFTGGLETSRTLRIAV